MHQKIVLTLFYKILELNLIALRSHLFKTLSSHNLLIHNKIILSNHLTHHIVLSVSTNRACCLGSGYLSARSTDGSSSKTNTRLGKCAFCSWTVLFQYVFAAGVAIKLCVKDIFDHDWLLTRMITMILNIFWQTFIGSIKYVECIKNVMYVVACLCNCKLFY